MLLSATEQKKWTYNNSFAYVIVLWIHLWINFKRNRQQHQRQRKKIFTKKKTNVNCFTLNRIRSVRVTFWLAKWMKSTSHTKNWNEYKNKWQFYGSGAKSWFRCDTLLSSSQFVRFRLDVMAALWFANWSLAVFFFLLSFLFFF